MKLKVTAVVLVFAAFWAAILVQGRYPKQTETRSFPIAYISRLMANNNLLASDNFVSGSLAAGWGTFGGFSKTQVVAGSPNVTEPNTLSTNAGQIWTGITWPNDQICEVTIQNLVSETNTFVDLGVRLQNTASLTGYLAEVGNGGSGSVAQIFRFDSGTGTQLIHVLGVTFAAGDVWTFTAAGAVLTLYQNGKLIARAHDATYTSGYPGYLQFTPTNITHTQVSSWRGYSAVQQDGVWQKQGVVVPAIAADLSTSFSGTANASKILFEGNAQLLSGNVYKMWFSSNSSNIYYAESLDGVNWTRSASAIIANFQFPQVIKVGSTYHLYCFPASGGTFNVAHYTSTNGTTWIQQSSNVFGVGTVGAWDASFIYGFDPVYINGNGTWYALYAGGNNATTYQGSLGLATSPDGINWTRSASNPLVTDFWNSAAIAQINGTWYMWGASNQPGIRTGQGSLLDPTDTIRMQSTDLVHWTNKISSLRHTQLYEAVNATTGQAFANSIIDIGGKAYLYYTASPGDSTTPADYQISLAIAPVPTASLVTKAEDAVAQTSSDAFTSSLSANWTKPAGGTAIQVVGNLAEPTATGVDCQAVYTGIPFSNDQYAEVTLAALGSSSFASPLVRAGTNALTWYEIGVGGPTGSAFTSTAIYKRVANVQTQIGPSIQVTPQVGDVFRLSVVGNVLSLFQNGFLILQVQDYSSSISSGSPGFKLNAATAVTNAQISLWAGGSANVIPSYTGSFAAQPIPPFQTNAGPGTNTSVILFGSSLGIEAHVTPEAPDPTNNAPNLPLFLGANPVGPSTPSSLNQYARPSSNEAITSTGIQFRNPA